MKRIKAKGVEVVVYEPLLDEAHFVNSEVTHELDGFKSRCDVIIANRMVDELDDVSDKVFTRICSEMTKIIPIILSGGAGTRCGQFRGACTRNHLWKWLANRFWRMH